jgi:hypothetical protein
MKIKLPEVKKKTFKKKKFTFTVLLLMVILGAIGYRQYTNYSSLQKNYDNLFQEKDKNATELEKISEELNELKNQDQVKINSQLSERIENIENTYDKAVSVYEDLLELKEKTDETDDLDELFAESLSLLSDQNYSTASAKLSQLQAEIQTIEQEIAASFEIPESVPKSNAPPGSGYSRQQVNTEIGTFLVSMIAVDYSSTKVIVDTASSGDCSNDCPVLPLSEYVSRNGAFAGVNGTYFCPASYPSCAGKTNSFDLLLMNKDKTYFNSDNNVYSGNPGVIFGGSYIRFVTAVSQWGRDTSIDSMISNFPLLVFNKQITFGGDDDPKKGSKGGRSFVANRGNTIYIGVVHNATVAESARVMKALDMDNAMNLDNGGSTALWSGGYKVGPGRNLPNVILFVSR